MSILRVVPQALSVVLVWASLGLPLFAQEQLHTVAGGAGSGFGRVASAGDVDGDGIDDLIVGEPLADAGGTDTGRATVYSGAGGAMLWQVAGTSAGDQLGWSCAGAGDTNADGHDDLIVGAPQTSSGGTGYARLYSGANGAVLRTLSGAASGDRFGSSVSGAGDLDADGKDDVLVGAPGNDAGGANAGSAKAYSGANGGVLYSTNGSSGELLGTTVGCQLPYQCTGDNEGDVLIGLTGAGNGNGAVQVRSRADFSLRFVLHGQSGEHFGATLAPAGDLSGDHVIDVLVATDPRNAQGEPTAAAQVRLFSGANGALLRTWNHGTLGSGYGASLAALSDVTGDGVPDIAVGEPGHDGNGTDAGALRIYSGANGSTWYHLLGNATGAGFGTGVAYAGDVNADGLPDCATGAPGSGSNAGTVQSLSVTRWNEIGSGLPGLFGVPRLTGHGGLIATVQASLKLTEARPGTTASLILGTKAIFDSSGKLTVVPELVVDGLVTSSSGTLDFDFTWPTGLPSGATIYHEFRIVDSTAPDGVAHSNAVAAVVP